MCCILRIDVLKGALTTSLSAEDYWLKVAEIFSGLNIKGQIDIDIQIFVLL